MHASFGIMAAAAAQRPFYRFAPRDYDSDCYLLRHRLFSPVSIYYIAHCSACTGLPI
jgi:hypothetical protein